MYGVDPMAFAVHAEYINRPSTVIVDPGVVVRLAYYGTYWGDRPTIGQTLEMIRNRHFEFEHPKRRKLPETKQAFSGAGRCLICPTYTTNADKSRRSRKTFGSVQYTLDYRGWRGKRCQRQLGIWKKVSFLLN